MKTQKLSTLKKKAWKAFSEYVRQKEADKNGMCRCVTCGESKPWRMMQAGHFIDGRTNSILFEEDGVHTQCFACNCMKHGNKIAYYQYMEKNYGKERIEELIKQSKTTVKFTQEELKEKIIKYKNWKRNENN